MELLLPTSKVYFMAILIIYRQLDLEKGYYLDGEDAKMMRKYLEDKYNLGLDAEDTIEVVENETEEEIQKAVETVA